MRPDDGAETFEVDPGWVKWIRVNTWLGAVLTPVFAAAPFLIGQDTPAPGFTLALFATLTVICGSSSAHGLRVLRRLSAMRVSMDASGLWPTDLGKNLKLVPWNAMHAVRYRRFRQRLEVLDDRGEVLLALEAQLRGFEKLRELVLQRMQSPPAHAAQEFSRTLAMHLFLLSIELLLGALAWAAATSGVPLVALFCIVPLVFFVYLHLTSIEAVRIGAGFLELRTLVSSRKLPLSEVVGVEFVDAWMRGTRMMSVKLRIRASDRPIHLGGDPVALYRHLSHALEATQRNRVPDPQS